MNTHRILTGLFTLGLFTAHAADLGFAEKFALAPDRAATLGQLVPRTEDYYRYHALHFQNTRQREKLRALLAEWAKTFPDSQAREVIRNREALLDYAADPKGALQRIKDHTSADLSHERQLPDAEPDLPTRLDPALVSTAAFRAKVLEHDDLSGASDDLLLDFAREKTPLNDAQREALLRRVLRPDAEGVLALIAAELTPRDNNRRFGHFPIHRQLLPAQLDALAKQFPWLESNREFVATRLAKLAAGPEDDIEFDDAAREAWLDRNLAYARTLAPSFNDLKARLLYWRLELDQRRGRVDRERFLEYLKLPRQVGYFQTHGRSVPDMARLNADVPVPLPPVQTDEPLVRAFFLQLLRAEDWQTFAEWVREDWLRPVFAEARITAGLGEPNQWAALLGPERLRELRDRVDIEFSPTNPRFTAPADDVTLRVTLKNTPKLLLRIYELNLPAFYQAHKTEVNTDAALDGLVAHVERSEEIAATPFQRMEKTLALPELKNKRGAWIVELIGGGKSSRALIRKGQFHIVPHIGPAGDVLTVLDEARQPVPDAAAWFAGRRYDADPKTGLITIPYTAEPGKKQVVISDQSAGFASLCEFEHHAEKYWLDASFEIEREQLLAGRQATLGIRPRLMLNGEPFDISQLEEPTLTITAESIDKVKTTQEIKIKKLDDIAVFTHQFTVPERLGKLHIQLSGKVASLTKGGAKETLTDSHSEHLNMMDSTDKTFAIQLSQSDAGYVLHTIGKNGEPVPNQTCHVSLTHRKGGTVETHLRTDAQGRITLGKIAGLAEIAASVSEEVKSFWLPDDGVHTHDTLIHADTKQPVFVPLHDARVSPALADVALYEIRNNAIVRRVTDGVKVANGFVQIAPLPPGDYELEMPGQLATKIKVTDGVARNGWLIGKQRHLESNGLPALQITETREEAGAFVIKLANADEAARVHVVASKFVFSPFTVADFDPKHRNQPLGVEPSILVNGMSGSRDLGDEQRYILDRRYERIFPGNMLQRPSLLLNPWELRDTSLNTQMLAGGDAPGRTGGGKRSAMTKTIAGKPKGELVQGEIFPRPNLDFLATPAPVFFNLKPDANGEVRIERKALGDRQYLQVVAMNHTDAAWRAVALEEQPVALKDTRLLRPFEVGKPFAEQRVASPVAAGESVTIEDAATSEFQVYDSLGGVFGLYRTLGGDAKLNEFAWLLGWPKLAEADKQAKYSEFACHELSFFLSKKDPEFFARVVQPYLRNKKQRTFMDDYLLEADLRPYLEPWSFARLNAAEQALIARRLPGEAPNIARHLRERVALIPPNPDADRTLFETALRGRALAADADADGAAPAAADDFKKLKQSESEVQEKLAELQLSDKVSTAGRVMNYAGKASAGAVPAAPAAPAPVRAAMAAVDALDVAEEAKSALSQNKAASGELLLGAKMDMDASRFRRETLGRGVNEARKEIRPFYRKIGVTKELAENHYYHLPLAQQTAELIEPSEFWQDYAAWSGKGPFLSAHVAKAGRNFSEIMLALAVLDLPFESGKHTSKAEGAKFTFTAGGPAVVYHQQIRPAAAGNADDLMVAQTFFRADDRYDEDGPERVEKPVGPEFLAGVIYGANVVLTNASATRRSVELLLQIPQGAIAVNGTRPTASRRLALEPYTTATHELFFYFPEPSAKAFVQFPPQAVVDGKAAGAAKPATFRVVKKLSEVDKTSWHYLSQQGSDDEVFAYLEKANLQRTELGRIAWRAKKSAAFLRKIVAFLDARHAYADEIYAYGLAHNDAPIIAQWLRHQDGFLAECGPWLDAPLAKIEPFERRTWEHLEYSPLVNQRAHAIGGKRMIGNEVFRAQWSATLDILAHKPALDSADQLGVVWALFLQDRTADALERLHAIKPETLTTRLQYDYLRAYAALYEEDLATARQIAAQYSAHPVPRWRERFAEVTAQLDEIEGKLADRRDPAQPDREAATAKLAATEPALDFKVEAGSLTVTYRNLPGATVNYYRMDPELLFSSSPFAGEDAGRFSIVKPTRTDALKLPEGKDTLAVELPADLRRANVLVEITAAGLRKTQAYHANTFKLTLAESYGRLDVRDAATDKPVSKAYVKVYARLGNGTVRFFKDGYTDLRGRFDYASLNGSPEDAPTPVPVASGSAFQMLAPGELAHVEKFSVLVLSDAHGAAVREAKAPGE